MDRKIIYSEMNKNVSKYVNKIISNKRTIVDIIKIDTIASAKQKLK